MAFSDPVTSPWLTALAAVLVAFFSATQDIAIDAYRIEILNDDEQGAGAATTQLGYRIALWIVDALALLLPSIVPWPVALSVIAALALVGIVTTFIAEEPKSALPPTTDRGGLAEGSGHPAVRRVPRLSRLGRDPAVRAALQVRRCAGRQHGAAVLRADGLLRPRDLRRHQELRRRRDHPGRAGRRRAGRALRHLQVAAHRRHPAGGHQSVVLLAGPGRPRHRRARRSRSAPTTSPARWAASPSSPTCRACAPPAWRARSTRC